MKNLIFLGILLVICLPASVSAQQKDTLRATNQFGDLKARHIGPALMSGRINDLEVHPKNHRIIYVASAGEESGSPQMPGPPLHRSLMITASP